MRPTRRAFTAAWPDAILVRSPQLCRETMNRAMARCTVVVDAADLPETWDSEVPLEPSPLNLYGHRPTGLTRGRPHLPIGSIGNPVV